MGRRLLISVFASMLVVMLMNSLARSEPFNLLGRPGNVMGYVSQGGTFSLLDKDNYDTEKGLQSALMNLFIEGDFAIMDDLKFYGAGMLTVDWVYQLKSNDSSWHDKLFDKSHNLNVDDEYWQLLKEAHLTWTPGDFMFRVGKQIVAWGETDGFRLMDQINPVDQRRGFSDVEFETTIIPIWLLRAEYNLPLKPAWLQNLNLQFIFNPNADFIPNQPILTGNPDGGIWNYNALLDIGPPPFFKSHLGTGIRDIRTPKRWKEGNEFGFRMTGVLYDSIVTLNGFYGRDNARVDKLVPPFLAAFPPIFASDGKMILHPIQESKYAPFAFVGGTFSRDIVPLRANFLGGVSPVLRLEAMYVFDYTLAFTNELDATDERFKKSDEFRGAIGFDWKVKIPLLNARNYFYISPQFYYRKIIDFPTVGHVTDAGGVPAMKKNNYQTTLLINTSYLKNKLNPSFFWMRDIESQSDVYRFQLVYDYNDYWHFTLGALLLDGKKTNQGFRFFANKDQFYFKISYKWQ